MGIFTNLIKNIKKYYEVNEIAEKTFKRDYLYLLSVIGLYPLVKRNLLPLVILQFTVILSLLLLHLYLFLNTMASLVDISFTLATFDFQCSLLIIFSLVVLIVFNFKRYHLNLIHSEMIYDIFKYEREDREILEGFYREINREKKMLLGIPILASIGGVNAIISGPILDAKYGTFSYNGSELSGRSWELPVPFTYHPLPLETNGLYLIASLLQGGTALVLVGVIGVTGYVFIHIVQILCLHIKYLSHNVEHLEERAEELQRTLFGDLTQSKEISQKPSVGSRFTDPNFTKCYRACLKTSFQHHQLILRWMASFQNIAQVPIGSAYVIGTVVIALSLSSIKTGLSLPGTFLSSIIFCLAETGFMALLSLLGQRIIDLSEDLRFKMYTTKWYNYPKSIQLDMEIFQEASLRPLRLTAFRVIVANNDTFSNVMNSAYTYYNLLMAF